MISNRIEARATEEETSDSEEEVVMKLTRLANNKKMMVKAELKALEVATKTAEEKAVLKKDHDSMPTVTKYILTNINSVILTGKGRSTKRIRPKISN